MTFRRYYCIFPTFYAEQGVGKEFLLSVIAKWCSSFFYKLIKQLTGTFSKGKNCVSLLLAGFAIFLNIRISYYYDQTSEVIKFTVFFKKQNNQFQYKSQLSKAYLQLKIIFFMLFTNFIYVDTEIVIFCTFVIHVFICDI